MRPRNPGQEMAQHANSDSDEDFHSIPPPSEHGDDYNALDHESIADMAPPVHPIPALQSAFEESIVESADDDHFAETNVICDAEARRRNLLEAKHYEDVSATRWKQRPGAQYHPFLKLMAQIVFGMHLLQQEQAKSNEEVVKILQNHVNEVDSFLERTFEDFDLAITDIEERIKYLQLPMQHMDVFEVMLDEKKFRNDLLSGNEKIEKIIEKTGHAMNDTLHDIICGIESIQELNGYLNEVEDKWPDDDDEIIEVLKAMRGNEQGWLKCFNDLKARKSSLDNELVTLENLIGEISRLAGEASRRNKPQLRNISPAQSRNSTTMSPGVRSRFAKDTAAPVKNPGPWLDKPLPLAPESTSNPALETMPKPHPIPLSTRFEQPRQHAPVPGSRSASNPPRRNTDSTRPRTSSSAVEPKTLPLNSGDTGKEVVSFVEAPGPSHPPGYKPIILSAPPKRKTARVLSQSAANVLEPSAKKTPMPLFKRNKSQGAFSLLSKSSNDQKPNGPERKAQTQFRFVPLAAPDKKDLSIVLGRRRSKQLAPIKTTLKPNGRLEPNEQTPRPIDSAYSSDRKRSTSSPTNFTTDTEKDAPGNDRHRGFSADPDKETTLSYSLAKDEGQSGRLALFPKVRTPSAPSHASIHLNKNPAPSSNTKTTWRSALEGTPGKPMHSSKASKTISIAKFFHRKGESQSVAAS